MPEITTGVSFDTVAREWRCKWPLEQEGKAALAAAQKALDDVLVEVACCPPLPIFHSIRCRAHHDESRDTGIIEMRAQLLSRYASCSRTLISDVRLSMQVKAVKGYKSCQRVVCGGCGDFKGVNVCEVTDLVVRPTSLPFGPPGDEWHSHSWNSLSLAIPPRRQSSSHSAPRTLASGSRPALRPRTSSLMHSR